MNKPALANQLTALSWVANGVGYSEREAAELLIELARWHPEVFDSLVQKPWVLDGVTGHETTAISEIRGMAPTSENLANRILAKSWMQDGITEDEATVIDRMSSTIRAEDESLQSEIIQKVIEILDMPFLDTVESSDAWAMWSLETFEDAGSAEFLELMAHPALSDGIDDEEAKIIVVLNSANYSVFDSLLQKPWLLDGLNEHESAAIERILRTASVSENLANRILAKPWMQDGITRDEARVIGEMSQMIRAEDESLQQEVIQKVVEILDMPFLDTVESPDALAMWSLKGFENAGSAEFLDLWTHPTLSDGIDDEEAKTVVLLGETNYFKPQLVPVLLGGSSVFKEERTINLPHSGEVLLAIIRFRDHSNLNMDYLEHAVRHHEGFMGEPLPTNYIAWYFVDYVPDAHHAGTHITSNPWLDHAGKNLDAPVFAAHETGHYYWTSGSQRWIHEGIAEMLVTFSENARIGRPLVTTNWWQCLFNTISEVVDAEVGRDAFRCSYKLGERLFLDLYRTLGEEAFQQAFRTLYLKNLHDDPSDDCEGTYLGICHVEAAFKSNVSGDVAARVDKVIDHWYHGKTATHEGDRAELAALYHEMGGANWTDSTNWLSDAHIGEWYGVTTDPDGRVTELDLYENGLSGNIPSGLGNLTNLKALFLRNNRLSGQIPPELGNLANLAALSLSNNQLTGQIPPELGNLANMTALVLSNNQLTGQIPSSLGNLNNLTYLELRGNRLTGCVPGGLNDVWYNDFTDLGLPDC